MVHILVMGSVAADDVVGLSSPMREGRHIDGTPKGRRIGGGGANTAIALARVGDQATLVASRGNDPTGDWMMDELSACGVDVGQVARIPGPSTRSIVMIDARGERTIVNLHRTEEAGPPARLLEIDADCLYVRSKAGGLEDMLTQAVRRFSLVVAHVPPLDEGCRPANVLVASRSDLPPGFLVDPFLSGLKVAGPSLCWVVVTEGADGATAFGPDGTTLRAKAPVVETLDSTGAGDAFAAGLCHALARGAEMAEALEIATAWGAESVKWEASALPVEAAASLPR